MVRSLLVSSWLWAALPWPVRAADQLEVQLDGLRVPVDLRELEAWSRDPRRPQGDLGVWLALIEPNSRDDLLRLLRAPLVRDRSLGQQLLNSWAGQRVLEEVGGLISTDQGNAAPLLLVSLQQLLATQPQVTTIELLRAVPSQRLILHVDVLLELAAQWRHQLQQQQQALQLSLIHI